MSKLLFAALVMSFGASLVALVAEDAGASVGGAAASLGYTAAPPGYYYDPRPEPIKAAEEKKVQTKKPKPKKKK